MPLSSEDLLRERKARLSRVMQIVGDDQGVEKRVLLARVMKATGVRKSTAYDYYDTLHDCGDIVEADGLVYTKKHYYERVQERMAVEAEKERRLTRTTTLDAFDLERA